MRRAFLVLFAALSAPALASEPIAWRTETKTALREAASQSKPVFVDAWAVWCGPCKQMDQTTYRDPQVAAAMDGFVPLKVDQDVQTAFCERHRIEVLPLVLFLDEDGEEIARLEGLQDSATLVAAMGVVREGYAAYRQALAQPKEAASLAASGSYLLRAGNPSGAMKLLRKASKALEGAAPAEREAVELDLARAQWADGDEKAATAEFQRLAEGAVTPAVRGGALEGLVVAYRARGDESGATAALEKLRREFPDLASKLTAP